MKPFPETAWRSLFADYRTVVAGRTEAPDEFHFGTSLVMFGHALEGSVSFPYPKPTYPLFSSLCIAETGSSRKSTALSFARGLALEPFDEKRYVLIQGFGGSGEGIAEAVADVGSGAKGVSNRHALMVNDELTLLLRKSQHRGSTIVETLIQLLDGESPLSLRTRSGPFTVTGLSFSMMSATTFTGVEETLTEDLVGSGLMNRILIFAGHATTRIALPAKFEKDLLQSIRDELKRIRDKRMGELSMSAKAERLFETWYDAWLSRRNGLSELQRGMSARVQVHAIRLAMLFAALDNSTCIKAAHVQAAIDVAEYCEEVALMVAQRVTGGADNRVELRVLELLTTRGPLTRREIHQHLGGRVTGERLGRILKGLVEMGRILESQQRFRIAP